MDAFAAAFVAPGPTLSSAAAAVSAAPSTRSSERAMASRPSPTLSSPPSPPKRLLLALMREQLEAEGQTHAAAQLAEESGLAASRREGAPQLELGAAESLRVGVRAALMARDAPRALAAIAAARPRLLNSAPPSPHVALRLRFVLARCHFIDLLIAAGEGPDAAFAAARDELLPIVEAAAAFAAAAPPQCPVSARHLHQRLQAQLEETLALLTLDVGVLRRAAEADAPAPKAGQEAAPSFMQPLLGLVAPRQREASAAAANLLLFASEGEGEGDRSGVARLPLLLRRLEQLQLLYELQAPARQQAALPQASQPHQPLRGHASQLFRRQQHLEAAEARAFRDFTALLTPRVMGLIAQLAAPPAPGAPDPSAERLLELDRVHEAVSQAGRTWDVAREAALAAAAEAATAAAEAAAAAAEAASIPAGDGPTSLRPVAALSDLVPISRYSTGGLRVI